MTLEIRNRIFVGNDKHYSMRHYVFGVGCYMEDDDTFAAAGHNIYYGKNTSFFNSMIEEAKHGGQTQDIALWKYSAVRERAELKKGTIPAFINIYFYYKNNDTLLNMIENPKDLLLLSHAEHYIIALNDLAQKHLKLRDDQFGRWATEEQWAKLSCKIRGCDYKPTPGHYPKSECHIPECQNQETKLCTKLVYKKLKCKITK